MRYTLDEAARQVYAGRMDSKVQRAVVWLIILGIPAYAIFGSLRDAYALFGLGLVWLAAIVTSAYSMGQESVMRAYGGLPRPKER